MDTTDDADKDTPNLMTPAAAGLVQSSGRVQTEEVPGRRGGPREYCTVPPPSATFGGTSITSWHVQLPFEVCWQQGDTATYCWAESWYFNFEKAYYPCGPIPDGGPTWRPIETADVVNGCDAPCQKLTFFNH